MTKHLDEELVLENRMESLRMSIDEWRGEYPDIASRIRALTADLASARAEVAQLRAQMTAVEDCNEAYRARIVELEAAQANAALIVQPAVDELMRALAENRATLANVTGQMDELRKHATEMWKLAVNAMHGHPIHHPTRVAKLQAAGTFLAALAMRRE